MTAAGKPVLMVDNKGYRYGDGLFETMRLTGKKISLERYHFERFFAGLQQMGFELPAHITQENLRQQVMQLGEKNNCSESGRVRLSAFRGNGGIYEGSNDLQYTIEAWPLDRSVNQLNENGYIAGVYTEARKSCDPFSNLKSANYLPYVMAARYAKQNKWNECLVINTHERIADATIANIFLIKGGQVITPPLTEGCVNGVMRKYLIERLPVKETPLTIEDILSADELFLTNAVKGIRWIKQFGDKIYGNLKTRQIHRELVQPLWQ